MPHPKLLVIAPAFPPTIGGVEKHLAEIIPQLTNRYDVTVLVRYDAKIPAKQSFNGVPVYRLPKRDGFPFIILWMIRHVALFQGVSFIHSHDYFPWWLRRLLKPKRWVHTFHGYEGYPIPIDAAASRQRVASAVDATVAVGKFIDIWYGTKSDVYIYGAVDSNQFKPGNDAEKVYDAVFVGRFEPDTGFESYIKAWKQVNKRILVIGLGSLEAWAKQYCQDNKLDVNFIGPQSDPSPYYRQAHVAYVSGYLAILEALASELPIIAYYNTPIKKDYLETHPAHEAILAASSENEIATLTTQAFASHSDHQEAFAWARQQSWKSIADTYSALYEPKN